MRNLEIGMRMACAVAIAVAVVTPRATGAQTPAAGDAGRGKELYLKYSCYACHGYDGHGGSGARLVPMRMTQQAFTNYVHSPRQMPPYTTTILSDAQAADLWTYIKSLPESPPASGIPLLNQIIGENK